jgi:hypothetical protein
MPGPREQVRTVGRTSAFRVFFPFENLRAFVDTPWAARETEADLSEASST